MRVLVAYHPILDAGGIINHSYHLREGLIECGHAVEVCMFTFNKNPLKHHTYELNQKKMPLHMSIGYKEDVQPALDLISTFDLIIWTVPVPTKNKTQKGNNKWPELLKSGVQQIGVIHDGHAATRTPYLHHVKDYFTCLACVHVAGFNACQSLSIPRTLAFNPFDLSEMNKVPYKKRQKGFTCIHNFKALKHIDDVVRAIPHIPDNIRKIVGGGGIEYHYMTSKDKCKPQYMENGRRIWDIAEEHGMEYTGFVQTEQRIKLYDSVTCSIDPSYITSYIDNGGAFNRTFVEAIISGNVPVMRDGYMDTSYFKPGKHFYSIPDDATPKEFAQMLTDFCTLSKKKWTKITDRNYAQLEKCFDRRLVASKYIEIANGNYHIDNGKSTSKVKAASNKILGEFFNIKTKKDLSWLTG